MSSTSSVSPGQSLLRLWHRLEGLPGGPWLFSKIVGWKVPYSATISPRIRTLSAGHCIIEIRDRHRVRNHLNSVHAIALVNIGELTGGLAVMSGLSSAVRGIVVSISIEYLKKARGTLQAECRCDIPVVDGDMEYEVQTMIRDSSGEAVARTSVNWKLGLVE